MTEDDRKMADRLGVEIGKAANARNLMDRTDALDFAARLAEQIWRDADRRGDSMAKSWLVLSVAIENEAGQVRERRDAEAERRLRSGW